MSTHDLNRAQSSARKTPPDQWETTRRCALCGVALPPYSGRGRPRKYCSECGSTGPNGQGAYLRDWKARNPAAVAAYNAKRRAGRDA